jgi:hypothetical protein
MGLLEESGLLMKQGEEILTRTFANGKIPRGSWTGEVESYHQYYKRSVREHMTHSIFNNGELVLTNSRLIAVAKLGVFKKNTIPFMVLDFDKIQSVKTEKPLIGKEALVVAINAMPPGKAFFEVDNASKWVDDIKNKLSNMQ